MKSQSKFLPDSVSGALKTLMMRMCGGAILVCGVLLLGALFFHRPYLDGFACASSFGNQSVVGNVVGFIRYLIGWIPTAFLILGIMRWGVSMAMNWEPEYAPEYNILRGFIAVCVAAMAFGLIAPNATYGGLFGAIVATDVTALIGNWGVIVGFVCLGIFVLIGGTLLHIKWSHVMSILMSCWRAIRWVLSAFHLVPPAEADAEEVEEEEAEEVAETAPEEVDAPKRKPRAAKKRTPVKHGADEYELPDPMLLEASNFGKNVVTPELKRQASMLETHFAEYGVYGKVENIKPGPIVTLYEFLPDAGMRISKISDTVKDMTRAMATASIRIAPLPCSNYIGVEVANVKPHTVRFRDLMESDLFVNSKYKIPLGLGVNIGGEPMYFDLAKMPHMLVAGRTGSGKSVFIQSIITSIVYHFTPDKCKLIIIDPKGVDFGFWDDIPHLITPIVKLDPGAAVNALKWAVREMDDRYKQLQLLNAQNIEQYNANAAKKRDAGETLTRQVPIGTDPETGELLFETQEVDLSDMPYIVIIIDEVADLMGVARKDVEACVQRIAQKARAAGIHLVMATQRPDATTITGVIKANFPTRLSFQASSRIDSMTTLGTTGAEQLLGRGDMLFSEGGKAPVRVHAAFIDNPELEQIGDFLRSQGEPEYDVAVVDGGGDDGGIGVDAGMGGTSGGGKKDDLYAQAVEIVRRDKKATISYLQRRLGIGYNKAAGLMERMEQDGVVSAADANNKRHIL